MRRCSSCSFVSFTNSELWQTIWEWRLKKKTNREHKQNTKFSNVLYLKLYVQRRRYQFLHIIKHCNGFSNTCTVHRCYTLYVPHSSYKNICTTFAQNSQLLITYSLLNNGLLIFRFAILLLFNPCMMRCYEYKMWFITIWWWEHAHTHCTLTHLINSRF